jgi:hypothetical protein
MRDQLTAKAPQTPFSKPQILSSFGVFGALAVPRSELLERGLLLPGEPSTS